MKQLVPQVLVADAERTASGTAVATLLGSFDRCVIELTCSAGSGTNETLDVYIQETLDGINYVDVAVFTQTTAALTNPHRVVLNTSTATDALKEGIGDATVSAGNLGLPLVTNRVRVKWVIGGTDTPTFTFGVNAYLDQQ